MTGPYAKLTGKLYTRFLPPAGRVSCRTDGGGGEDRREHMLCCVMFQDVPPPFSSSMHCHPQ